uniref:Uncharacterized protein n=1 Tax=Balaenoptera musculus TaxID=9771 RepID=A0A8C0CJN5_BALMU
PPPPTGQHRLPWGSSSGRVGRLSRRPASPLVLGFGPLRRRFVQMVPALLLNFLALLWIGVNCSPRKWLQRNLPSKEKRRTQACRSVSAFLFDPKWTHILYGGWTVY